jgi:mRNA-degrading endonuclease RelE of RelBE toxin-antitoxin system
VTFLQVKIFLSTLFIKTMTKVAPSAVKRILKEIEKLHQQPPEDIQIILNEENLTEIQAWIRGPGKKKKKIGDCCPY